MKYELIVFDLDGTLVDSIPDIAEIYNDILSREGYPVYSEEDYRKFVGWGLKKALELALPGKSSDEEVNRLLDDIFNEYRRRPAKLSRVYPGIHELLNDIAALKVPMIVYTNKAEILAEAIVEKLFTADIFDRVLGYTGNFPHKPDPAALNEYIDDKNIPLSSILMVGDSSVDLETARNAAVSFAGASWGFRSEKELKEAGSDRNFPMPVDLHRWLMKLKDDNHDK